MNYQDQLQAEQSILLEMALMNEAINQHKEDVRSEYLEEHRRTLAEVNEEFIEEVTL